MRLFKSSSRRNAAKLAVSPSPPPIAPMDSIGSELAASDQFEILVTKKFGEKEKPAKPKSSPGIMSYFSKDNDDSTVSSITEGENRGIGGGAALYRFHKSYYDHSAVAAASSISSWCCCNGSTDALTQRTYRTHGTDNTLLARDSIYGTLQLADSRSQYRSPHGTSGQSAHCVHMVGDKCCGPDYSVPAIKRVSSMGPNRLHRPLLRCRRGGWELTRRGSRVNSEMSASLFDNLSDDEDNQRDDTETGTLRTSRSVEAKVPQRRKTKPLRRGLTWKRK